METRDIPLFPLQTVLFKDGQLPLKIFEPRYVDMVGRCLKQQTGFGVVLIRSGSESRAHPDDKPPEIFDFGMYAEITDFNSLPGGFLGIIGTGRSKFRVLKTWLLHDGLLMGTVEILPEEPSYAVPEEFRPLATLLEQLLDHPLVRRLHVDVDLNDARAVSWRLSELLPVEPEIKQTLLKLTHPRERLAELRRLVERLQ